MNRAAFFVPTVKCGFVRVCVFCPFLGASANPRRTRVCPNVHERLFFVSAGKPRRTRVCPRNDEKHPFTPGGVMSKNSPFALFYIPLSPPLFFCIFAVFVDKPTPRKGFRITRFFPSWPKPRRITSAKNSPFFFHGQTHARQRPPRFKCGRVFV